MSWALGLGWVSESGDSGVGATRQVWRWKLGLAYGIDECGEGGRLSASTLGWASGVADGGVAAS